MKQEHQITVRYLEVSPEAEAALFSRHIEGLVTMLNLLRFRDVADYLQSPELMPTAPISGAEAFQKYIDYTLPLLKQSGGELVFLGEGGAYLIGPQEQRWDLVMLVRQNSPSDFMAFASNQAYLAGLGHRTAALEDSRLLPKIESKAAI